MKATRESYGEALVNLGEKYKDIVVLDADLATATKTIDFKNKYPERFFDMGIAEQDLMGTAAGLALGGKIPFASTFAIFASGRAYDQIRNSICYSNLNVKIAATHAGITVGEDGASHQALEDIALMRAIPNLTVISPSDDVSTKYLLEEAVKYKGPVYIRLARPKTEEIYEEGSKFEIGKAVCHGDGEEVKEIKSKKIKRAFNYEEDIEDLGIEISSKQAIDKAINLGKTNNIVIVIL